MPFHLCAFSELLGTTANTDIDEVQDDILASGASGGFFLTDQFDLIAAYASSATLNRARLRSPTLDQITPPMLRPVSLTLLPPTDPNVVLYVNRPFRLPRYEDLRVEATSDIAMGTERFTALLWLQSTFVPSPTGEIYTLRGTSTTAAVANSWTTIIVTWDTSLPAGTYAVVGGECFATNQIAFRLILDHQLYRPGSLGFATLGLRSFWQSYKGGLGEWGRFNTTSFPRVQVHNNATDAVHTIYLDLVQVSRSIISPPL